MAIKSLDHIFINEAFGFNYIVFHIGLENPNKDNVTTELSIFVGSKIIETPEYTIFMNGIIMNGIIINEHRLTGFVIKMQIYIENLLKRILHV